MSDNRLFVHVLLDRSGSMESCRDSTIAAYNTYAAKLKEAWKTPTRFSLTLFDSESIDLVHEAVPIGTLPDLSRSTFVPRGSTPLLDAIGKTVARIETAVLAANERVTFVILTDGQENASREHTTASITKLLAGRQEDKDWLVLYLGANQDAFREAAAVGIGAAHSMDYAIGNEKAAFAAISRSTSDYARAPTAQHGRAQASFSPGERAEAKASDKGPDRKA